MPYKLILARLAEALSSNPVDLIAIHDIVSILIEDMKNSGKVVIK